MIALHTTGGNNPLWLSWDFDPIVIVIVLTAGLLYTRGLGHRSEARLRLHPWWRPVLYYTGLGTLLFALISPLDHLADELFFMHMIQHLLLTITAAPLILLGAPMIPVLRGIPRPVRRAVVVPFLRSPLVRKPLKLISLPILAWALYVGAIVAWHTPNAYDFALRNGLAHDLEHLSFSLAAILFWWNVINPVPLRANLSYLARVPYVFLTTVPNFVLGAFITLSENPWYSFDIEQNLRWGLSAQEDQQIGGVLMWVPGSLVLLSALLIVLAYVVITEQRKQESREAQGTMTD